MKKRIIRMASLVIPRGQAKPGAALSSWGINMMNFCKEFNALTSNEEVGKKVSTKLTVFEDKSFSFEVKKSHVSSIWREIVEKTGKKEITSNEFDKIVEIKMSDLNTNDPEKAKKTILGSLKSAGIKVI
jgi:large subunit ribosomal protein L11